VSVNVGHSDLGGKVRVLLSVGILDFYDVVRCLFSGVGLVGLAAHPAPCGRTLHLADRVEKKKEVLERSRTLPRELEELDAPLDRTTLGAALDAGGRSGPRWTGDAWLARRRRYSTARRDRVIA
jgi:hypothetical protein